MLNKYSTLETIGEEKIKSILTGFNYLDVEDLKKAEVYAKQNKASFLDFLYANELISNELLGQAISESFEIPFVDLKASPPTKEFLDKIPEDLGKKFRVVCVEENGPDIVCATDNPDQGQIAYELGPYFPNKNINLAYALSEDINQVLLRYRKSLEARFVKIINDKQSVAPEIIKEIIDEAIAFRASDIHFEPQEDEVIIRFRIDGVLIEMGRIPTNHYNHILNRTKVQARLRIDEHFTAQDGAVRFEVNGEQVDLRISIVPTIDGEKIVIRVLSQYVRNFTLADLGFTSGDQAIIDKAVRKPFGMILVTGPTGSGKTTSLYAVLKNINRPEINITAIEDPVEYKLSGINQIQVDKENITFAKGLRSIVRQDPDIILVGEIRDEETAEIAVNIALTGHLLLSTFHSNDAATTIPRLLDMNIEPFLLASTLELVVAQRLARKICSSCRYSYTINMDEIGKLIPGVNKYFTEKTTLYSGKGCEACGHTGYSGRTAIFEFIVGTKELRDLILSNPSTKEIWDLASSQGSLSLFEDGIRKVKSGLTTVEELLRVVAPPDDN